MLTDGQTDGRKPDAGVTGILIAHLRAFGPGELINIYCGYPWEASKETTNKVPKQMFKWRNQKE